MPVLRECLVWQRRSPQGRVMGSNKMSPMCVCTHSIMSNSLRPHGLWPTRFLCLWDSPGKNTGAGCHFLLQEIFLTQGSNSCLFRLLHWQVGSLPAEPSRKPEYLQKRSCLNWVLKDTQKFAGQQREENMQRHRGMRDDGEFGEKCTRPT